MSVSVHPAAVVDASARLADGVEVGPYAVIGAEVEIGAGTVVGAGAHVEGPARLGAGNRIFSHACIGFDPQDLKYQGEHTRLEIGDRNTFREFSTVHRGTGLGGGLTSIGDDNLFMAYTHVAHDCRIGSRTIFSNAATLAGHVVVHDDAVVGAFGAVHQFCRVGRFAYIGGFSVITMDALPYARTVGQKPVCIGLNRIGLERKGVDAATVRKLESVLRIVLRSGLNLAQAVERVRREFGGVPEVDYLVEFVEATERGIIKALPGRRGARGAGAGPQ